MRVAPNITIDQLSFFQNADYNKLYETFRVSQEIIEQLTPEAVNEIWSSCNESDIDTLLDSILGQSFEVLYGKNVKKTALTSENFGYLDKLSDSVEETLRCESFPYFITSVMPDFEMSWHHNEWCNIAEQFNQFCVMAARDHGKSYLYSNAFPAWKMYKFKGHKGRTPLERNNRGFLFSFSIQQAIDLLDILKDNISNNDILREKLHNPATWNKTDITCKNRARLTVKGFGSAVRGAHPAWIMIDDGLKDNVMYSKMQRDKSINYFHSVIMNMIVPGGQVGLVGTPFHSQDLYGDLKTRKGWTVFEYPAVFPDGTILWPGRWDFASLMNKRDSQGNLIFSRELLCRPVTSDSTIFPIEILNNAFMRMESYTLVNNRDSFPIKFNKVVNGTDFAISSSVGADYFTSTTWGIDDQERMWLLNAFRAKGMSYAEQQARLKSIYINFRPDVMVLEANVFQAIYVQENEKQGLPVVPHITGKKKNDLREGWPSLAILFERGRYKIPTGDQYSKDFSDMVISEFSSITFTEKGLESTTEHDDICSSFYMAKKGAEMLNISSFNFSFA